MRRYLGIICLLYSGIFSYVVLFDKLKLFLAPGMQIYIKLSIIPLLLIGLVMIFNSKVHYKFKISDLVLLLPLILLIFAGDGRLTASFASNRSLNQKNANIVNKENKKDEKQEDKKEKSKEQEQKSVNEEQEEIIQDELKETYDFSNPYFDVVDESYELSSYLTYNPKADKYEEKTIRVRGFAIKKADFLPNGYFAIGKYAISCCAADAGFTGFISKYDNKKIKVNQWYEVEGVLRKGKDKGNNDTMYIEVINIKEIDSKKEEQYVYPCYSYGDNSCSELIKYDLEY